MTKYVQELKLDRGGVTLEDLDNLVEAVRQYAFPELVANEADRDRVEKLRVTIDSGDQWAVFEQAMMVKDELDAYQHCLVDHFEIDRKYLVEP